MNFQIARIFLVLCVFSIPTAAYGVFFSRLPPVSNDSLAHSFIISFWRKCALSAVFTFAAAKSVTSDLTQKTSFIFEYTINSVHRRSPPDEFHVISGISGVWLFLLLLAFVVMMSMWPASRDDINICQFIYASDAPS